MEIEAALYALLTLGLYIRQIINNDANIVPLIGTDINECLLDACGSNSICANTKGSFHCKCKPGFRSKSGDGKDCSGETIEIRGCFFLKWQKGIFVTEDTRLSLAKICVHQVIFMDLIHLHLLPNFQRVVR